MRPHFTRINLDISVFMDEETGPDNKGTVKSTYLYWLRQALLELCIPLLFRMGQTIV